MSCESFAMVYSDDDIDGFLESVNFLIAPHGLEIVKVTPNGPGAILGSLLKLEVKKENQNEKS